MKNKTYNINRICTTILLVIAVTFSGWSQNYDADESENSAATTELNGTTVSPEVFAAFGFNTAENPRSAIIEGNSVFVRQFGELNQVVIATDALASEINLVQNGNENKVQLDYTTNTAIADLTQNGNNNQIKDIVVDQSEDISLDLTQQGDNLKFERYNVNSITKSLKFTQTQASPTIIIRSFK